MFNFFIVRLTNRVDGTAGNIVHPFESESDALKDYFRECGKAVDSTHLTDSVSMLTKEGFELRHETFAHEPVVEEPVEEEIPTEEPVEG